MKRILSLLLAAAALLTAFAAAPAAATEPEAGYTSRTVKAYLFNRDDTGEFTCLFRDDLPSVPYISAVDFLDQLYTVTFDSDRNADGTYTVSNVNGEMIVDTMKDTVHFEAWEDLVDYDVKPVLDTETADYLSEECYYEVVGESNPIDLDLGKYGIDIVSSGDDVYFPLSAINDIFAGTYRGALYLEDELYFVQVMEEEPYYDTSSLYQNLNRDKTLVEYTYNELCFVMDNFYGCPPKAELAQSIREKGFDRTLEEYNADTAKAKELLLSTDLVDYVFGLLYLDMYLDDGGHTVMSIGANADVDSPFMKAFSDAFRYRTDEKVVTVYSYLMDLDSLQNAYERLERSRDQAFSALAKVKAWDENAAFYRAGDIGIFTFDDFKDAVVEPFKWSLDYAEKNGINTFLIDLSLNTGGSTAVAAYMLSIICDDPRSDYENRLTGNRFYTVDIVDRNLDGEFDSKDDEVGYDLTFAVLTSQFSFSCANELPCLLQDHGVAVVGETSGGGTCVVALHFDPAGYCYALSDSLMITYADGSHLDDGASPDVPMPGKDDRYMGFYDFEAMQAGILSYYASNPTEPASAAADASTPDEKAAVAAPREFGDLVAVLWVIVGAVALICVVAFVVVMLGSRNKRRFY